MQAAFEHDLSTVYSQIISMPYHGSFAAKLHEQFQMQCPDLLLPAHAESHLMLQEAITMWQEANLLVPQHACHTVTAQQVRIWLQQIRIRYSAGNHPLTCAQSLADAGSVMATG